MTALITIVLLATLVQYLVDIIKNIVPITEVKGVKLAPIYAALVGVAMACLTKTDILSVLGYESGIEAAGWIITGLIVSGGSSAVHELISKLRESREPDELR